MVQALISLYLRLCERPNKVEITVLLCSEPLLAPPPTGKLAVSTYPQLLIKPPALKENKKTFFDRVNLRLEEVDLKVERRIVKKFIYRVSCY